MSLGREVELTPELEDELRLTPDVDVEDLNDWISQSGSAGAPTQISLPREWQETEVDLAAALEPYRMSLLGDTLRAVSEEHSLPSSALSGTDLWQVSDIGRAHKGVSLVSLGRLGLRELEVSLPAVAARQVSVGDRVVGVERLHSQRTKLGFSQVEIDFQPDGSPPSVVPMMLPLLRLHVPRRRGCKANYIAEGSSGSSVEFTLLIMGMGGGGGVSVTGTFSRDYTSDTKCVEMVVPAKLELQVGSTLMNGTVVAYGMRAKVIDGRA